MRMWLSLNIDCERVDSPHAPASYRISAQWNYSVKERTQDSPLSWLSELD